MSSPVEIEIVDRVAIVALNRPDRLNAVSHALRRVLIDALGRLDADPHVSALVITGRGHRAFSAGQDLDEAVAVEWTGLCDWLLAQQAMYQAMRDVSKPCVAAINGIAAGAGLQLALCCDWRIAGEGARLGQPEVKAGLASIVGSYLMSLHVGHTHNVALSLSGELVTARRGHEIGLVTEVVADADLATRALERARALAALPATAMRLTKARFRALTQPGFEAACLAGISAQLQCYADGTPQAAMAAFIEARRNRTAS